MIFGAPLLRFASVGSTQDVARERLRAGAGPGAVVVADAMTAGRGRRGRAWSAPAGSGVYLTAIGAAVEPERLWQLAPLAGLAACEAVRTVAPAAQVRLRFPNDLALQGRKLAGVLIEAVTTPAGAVPLIGVGVNVARRAWPAQLEGVAIALAEVAAPATAWEVEAALLHQLGVWWSRWEKEGFAPVAAAWNAGLEPAAERTFVVDGHPMRCQVRGLTVEGLVRIVADGRERSLPVERVVLGEA